MDQNTGYGGMTDDVARQEVRKPQPHDTTERPAVPNRTEQRLDTDYDPNPELQQTPHKQN